MNKQELIDKAVSSLNGKLMRSDDEIVIMDNWTKTFVSLKLKAGDDDHTYVCSASEFTKRARELGWCNGYKYGVEYETNGKKPDLPDDVLVEVDGYRGKTAWAVKDISWRVNDTFRIVDERYNPAEHKENKLARIFTTKDFPGLPVEPAKEKSWHEKGELPPVGVECEVKHNGEWVKCTVIHHANNGRDNLAACKIPQHIGSDVGHLGWFDTFRPLKTERERFVEAAFESLTIDNSDLAYKICQDLYDNGFLKAPDSTI